MQADLSAPVLAAGELLWDMMPSGARLGGTTANFAVLCAQLGEYAALISCVGNDPLGREATGRLAALASGAAVKTHLDLSGIQVSPDLPTGTVSVTVNEEGRPQYQIDSPVAWDAIQLTPQLLDLASHTAVICFGTLAQRSQVSRASIRALVEAAGSRCVRVCDLNIRAPFCTTEVLEWCLSHADVLKVSDEELPQVARLLGKPRIAAGFPCETGDSSLTEVATQSALALLDSSPHCKLVSITLGPHGSLMASREGVYRHKGRVVEVRDTVGAGDAFTAGMVHAYIRDASLAQMSEVSNLCGSYVASQFGATPELPAALIEEIRSILGR
jgi:fructokinase